MFTRFLLAASLLLLVTPRAPLGAAVPAALPADARAVVHSLNRLGFGPKPGDVERVQAMGLRAWIEQQLAPSRISTAAVDARLARLSTLGLDPRTLAREYHVPAQLERRRLQEEQSGTGSRPPNDLLRKDQQIITDLSEAKLLRAVYSDRQLEEVLVDFWFNHFNVFAGKGPERVWVGEYQREAIRPYVLGNFRQMLEAVAKSEAMLFYLDNWQSGVATDVGSREPGAGNRPPRQRLALSDADPQGPRSRRGPFGKRATGINENYARELMELHTLGVDGGYTQQDIVEVARAFTGWTIGAPGESGFRFDESMHDRGEKHVLGHVIKAGGGQEDGRQVLDILATHPATARFIAKKLAVRFVSDDPTEALVDRAAARFTATRGDLREVLRTIISSPEFFAPEAYGAKVKTPFEFVVSAMRATGADLRTALPLVRELRDMGMPLYFCNPPTGYDDTAATWVSSGALVARMNFAVALGGNTLRGVRVGLSKDETAALNIGGPGFQKR